MKKIVYVTEAMGGGVLTYLEELANSLCNRANVYILYGNRKQTPANLRELFDKRVHLIKIKNFQRALNPVKDLKAYFELHKIIKQINPNIIHLNSSKAGALGRLLIHHRGQKWFYTPHGYAFLMQDSARIKRLIYYLVEWLFAKFNTETIACGYSEYKIAKKLSKNSTYVNNGVNINILKKYWSQKSNTQDIFFTIGRINYQKDPTLFNKIALQFPEYKFIWFGDGPLKNRLTANNIKVTGWLPSNQLFKMIQPYKYFILCSRWEGLPIALLEAMYFKKLCFVTDVTGNRDVILSGYNGILFRSINILNKYINNMNKSKYLMQNANNTIIKYYKLYLMICKYFNIYFGTK